MNLNIEQKDDMTNTERKLNEVEIRKEKKIRNALWFAMNTTSGMGNGMKRVLAVENILNRAGVSFGQAGESEK